MAFNNTRYRRSGLGFMINRFSDKLLVTVRVNFHNAVMKAVFSEIPDLEIVAESNNAVCVTFIV